MFPLRRLLLFTLIFAFLVQVIVPTPTLAIESKVKADTNTAKITLEQAIRIVKQNFTIPEEFRDFRSGYSSYNQRQTWSLNWNASTGAGSFSAQVDATSGEIVNLYSWSSADDREGYKLPQLSLKQAEKLATETVHKLTGSKYEKLQLVKNEAAIPLTLYGSQKYNFYWQRIENGLPVQGNGVSIQIDGESGQVNSYSLSWHELDFPDPEKVINKQKAAQAFSENAFLQLEYFVPIYRILTTENNEQIKLVYQLKNNGMLDAISGKPFDLEENLRFASDGGGLENAQAKEAAEDSVVLSPEELREIEENTKLLTSEQAITIVKKWIEIPTDYTLQAMSLNKSGGFYDSRIWYFEWLSRDEGHSQSITARVDAVDGELLGFSLYNPIFPLNKDAASSSKLSADEARQIAENFLQKIQPAKFSEVRLKTDNQSPLLPEIISEPESNQTHLTFSYERMIDGIAFPANGMSITVDLYTKKISSYSLNWWNLTFPKASTAMAQAKAEALFLEARPLVLNYILVYKDGQQQAKLVYLPSDKQQGTSDLMDAKTGQFLNRQGNPLSEPVKANHFEDIAGHEAEKEIAVLGLAGIFGEYGKNFKPTSELTLAMFLKALLMIDNSSSSAIYNLTDREVLKKAQEQGWLKEDLAPSQVVSRYLASKIIVRYLGLEKIAELDGIYQLPFADQEDISPEAAGYIALASGLNILQAENNKFEPHKTLTRAEAASVLIKSLNRFLQ
jgi:hypothetical protein